MGAGARAGSTAASPTPITVDMDALPSIVVPYVEALGLDAAVLFLLEFGGAPFYLAADPKGRAETTIYLGRDRARKLVAALRKVTHANNARVPTAKPFIARYWRSQGMAYGLIARKLHVNESTVRRWLDGATAAQLELFG